MQIIEISEPGSVKITEEIVVGIDFGTTNSLIAISENYNTKIIPMQDNTELVSSIISIINQQFIVGKKPESDDIYIRSIKKLLAKSSSEIKNNPSLFLLCNALDFSEHMPTISLNDKILTLPEVAAEIFKYLKYNAEQFLKSEVKKVVVSIPAYFDDNSRGQVLLAAKLAGLEVLRLIAEPTAAAYAYGLNRAKEGCYLVYDLGGGTFDVSILEMQTGVFQVIATGGDNMLGGDDIDMLLADYISKQAKIEWTKEFIYIAKDIKERLSYEEEYLISLNNIEINLTRTKFEEIISSLINRTVKIAKDTLYDAGNIALDGIILVGGSTRIPLIYEELAKNFNTNIYSDLDPDKIVAIGAAMQAENLSSKSNALLIDVLPLSVGLELHGGIVEKIIHRNTPIPFSVTQEFTTHLDNQTGMKFHIVQGEREMATDCRSLANFELNNIPLMKAGKVRIEVIFSIDADSILSVNALELKTGNTTSVTVKPSYGLTEDQVTKALTEAYKNAEKDYNERLLMESKGKANKLIIELSKILEEARNIVTGEEIIKIKKSINTLQKLIKLDNREDILVNIKILNDIASNVIQKYLDKNLELNLKGKNISEI